MSVYVACKNRGSGCPVVMVSGKELARHEDECPHTEVTCPLGCGQRFKRFDLQQHLTICLSRHFSDAMLRDDLQMVCKNCEETFAAMDIQSHSATCPGRKLKCYLQDLGCDFSGTAEELARHQCDRGPRFHLFLSLVNKMHEERAAMRQAIEKLGEEYLQFATAPDHPLLNPNENKEYGERIVKEFKSKYQIHEPNLKKETLNLVVGAEVWQLDLSLHELKEKLYVQVYGSVEEGLSRAVELNPGLEADEVWEGGRELGQVEVLGLPWHCRLYSETKDDNVHDISLGLHQMASGQKTLPPGLQRVMFCLFDPITLRVHYYSIKKRLVGDSCLYSGRIVVYFGPFPVSRDLIKALRKKSKCRKFNYAFLIYKSPDRPSLADP